MSLTLLDREQLENQLLADPMPRPHCLDSVDAAAPAYFEDPGYRRTLLRHRLAVARELLLRDALAALAGRDVVLITPGVRPAGADVGDQRRVATPREALDSGADLLVIGRPITGAADPAEAARAIAASLA